MIAKRRRQKYRFYKGKIGKIAPNVLNRDFYTTAPKQKWTTDVTDILRKAFNKHPNLNGLIFHSDQGWHYQHMKYRHMLKERGIIQSMSRKGNYLDNSMMENFFGLMKNELLYLQE